jgi:hypothetical protein
VIEPAEERAEPVAGTALVPADPAQEAVSQPAYGVRGDAPGPRGCWAAKRNGEPCGAAPRRGEDYCNGHSGHGVAMNPVEWSAKGRAAAAESRRRRAALRLALGITGTGSPRALLKAAVVAEAERIVAAALSPIGDDSLGSAAKQRAALALLDAADPMAQASLELPLPSNPEGVEQMGLEDLRALAQQVGITSGTASHDLDLA